MSSFMLQSWVTAMVRLEWLAEGIATRTSDYFY